MSLLATIVSQQKSNMSDKGATTESKMSLEAIHAFLKPYEEELGITSDMPLYAPCVNKPGFDTIDFDESEASTCARMGNVHRRLEANIDKAVDSWIDLCNLKDAAEKVVSRKERESPSLWCEFLAKYLKKEKPFRLEQKEKWESLSKQFHSSLAVKQFHVITKWNEVIYIRAGDDAIPAKDGLSTSQVPEGGLMDKTTEKSIGTKEINAFITNFEEQLGFTKVNYDGSQHAKDDLGRRFKAVENALSNISHPVRKVELMRQFYSSREVAIIATGNQRFREKMKSNSSKVNAVELPVSTQIVIPTAPLEKNPQPKVLVWGAKEETTSRLNLCKADKKRKRSTAVPHVDALNGNSLPAEDSRAEKRQRVNTTAPKVGEPRSADYTI